MERFPGVILGKPRSPAKALADLVEKFDRMAHDNPELPMLARMIRQLAEEIVLRKGTRAFLERRAMRRGTEWGLC